MIEPTKLHHDTYSAIITLRRIVQVEHHRLKNLYFFVGESAYRFPKSESYDHVRKNTKKTY